MRWQIFANSAVLTGGMVGGTRYFPFPDTRAMCGQVPGYGPLLSLRMCLVVRDMITTPGVPDAPGGRPPELPPMPQCLFPSDIKTCSVVVPVDSVGSSIDDGFLLIDGGLYYYTALRTVSSNRPSRYWGPHTTSRKCVSAFLRLSCTAYTLSRAHVLPDGSPRTNLKKHCSSSSRKAPMQQR